MTPLTTQTVPPSIDELLISVSASADPLPSAATAKVMASLALHPDRVQVVGCLGAEQMLSAEAKPTRKAQFRSLDQIERRKAALS